jgi:hypothetical protein
VRRRANFPRIGRSLARLVNPNGSAGASRLGLFVDGAERGGVLVPGNPPGAMDRTRQLEAVNSAHRAASLPGQHRAGGMRGALAISDRARPHDAVRPVPGRVDYATHQRAFRPAFRDRRTNQHTRGEGTSTPVTAPPPRTAPKMATHRESRTDPRAQMTWADLARRLVRSLLEQRVQRR